jgi:hypothetical protein
MAQAENDGARQSDHRSAFADSGQIDFLPTTGGISEGKWLLRLDSNQQPSG